MMIRAFTPAAIAIAAQSLLSLSSPTVAEGDVGTTVLRFVLSRAADGYGTINYAAQTIAGGTATAGVDYTSFSQNGSIASGQTVNLDVSVIGDTTDESDETVIMQVLAAWA